VLLIDSLIPDHGGNLFNIAGLESRLRVNIADVRQASTMNYLVKGQEVIFNLAGRSATSTACGIRTPISTSTAAVNWTLLEACRLHNPETKVVFAGDPGKSTDVPNACRSTKPIWCVPPDINGINKAAGEYYHLVYNNVFGVRACSLRLTNVYGPRPLIRHNRQGFIGWFVRSRSKDREIQVYGDGSQVRDFVYVDGRRRCVSPCRRHRRRQRRRVQRRRQRADRAPRSGPAPDRGVARRIGGLRSLARGKAEDRHRLVLFGFVEVHRRDRLEAAHGHCATASGRRSTSIARTSIAISTRAGGVGPMSPRVPFMSLVPGEDAAVVRDAIDRVVERGWFILGPELAAFEEEFAAASGSKFAVGVGTGTDALALALRAMGIGPGDEVITTPLSAAYSALAIMMAGATPVFADIDESG
jgi:hypothetical protein